MDQVLETPTPNCKVQGPTRFELGLLGAVAVLVSLMLVATLWVIVGDQPQVFNQKTTEVRLLTFALGTGEATLLTIIVVHIATGRWRAVAMFGAHAVFMLVLLDLLVMLMDRHLVSVEKAWLIRNLRNVSVGSEVLPLPQPNPQSPFGFRMARTEPLVSPDYRILVLGNSFTRGSGSTFDTNYPQVIEDTLRRNGFRGGKVSVFAAGVDGYGLEEMLKLYRLLETTGYRFDAVLLNIMMGSDLSNNIPGTWRRAMAGEPQRFYSQPFIDRFFPIDSYLFRYMYYVLTLSEVATASSPITLPIGQACVLNAKFRRFATERIGEYYSRLDQTKIYPAYNFSFADQLIALAVSKRQSVYVVLQPDANAALDSRRALLPGLDADWDRNRGTIAQYVLGKAKVFDLATLFRNNDSMFKCNDTHWTNEGNVLAGEAVAEWIAFTSQRD